MSSVTPALLTQRGAQRLPRIALLVFCAAYVLPGIFGRDPWRSADLSSYGLMAAMAEGRTSWWAPALGQLSADTALLPHWIGAAFIALLGPSLGGPLAARLPFAILLSLILVLVWYATYNLARTEAAQPVAFAFGGEAAPVDYARAIADAALLALIATLGLLQMGHETTPELAQLFSVALVLWALAAAPYRGLGSRLGVIAGLMALSASGAPAVALAFGAGATLLCARSRYPLVRRTTWWVGLATGLSALTGLAAQTWGWRVLPIVGLAEAASIARQWAWFLWPAWPAMLWSLWRWRRHITHRHVAVPMVAVVSALAANLVMAGSDRALLLALPGSAMLAAFALPTLRRSASAAIDWLSMSFFTIGALTIWVIYLAMMTGWPVKPAANVAKLAPGFVSEFSAVELALALLASLAWVWLLRWRTGRHQEAVWKSMVIPAGGVALCWLLLMTLWLPLLDYARSLRPWVDRLAPHIDATDCVRAPGLSPAQIAALETHGHWRIDARAERPEHACATWLFVAKVAPLPAPPAGWTLRAQVQRPSDRDEVTAVWVRSAP